MSELEKALKLLGPWTLEGAIKERVEREAMAVWALREVEPHRVIPPMPQQGWQPTPLHAFLSKVRP
jgi:hypothetical protein